MCKVKEESELTSREYEGYIWSGKVNRISDDYSFEEYNDGE